MQQAIDTTWDSRQQSSSLESTRHGSIAVWVLIFAELTEFAFFFIAFIVVRNFYPEEFAAGPAQLNTTAGLSNALILISSSFFVAMSLATLRRGKIRQSQYWLITAIGAGLLYCAVKYWEYQWNAAQGLSVQSNYFFTLYYYLTFNHLLHVLVGIVILSTSLLTLRLGWATPASHQGMEGCINYWHMVDLAWIILFPLLYLLN